MRGFLARHAGFPSASFGLGANGAGGAGPVFITVVLLPLRVRAGMLSPLDVYPPVQLAGTVKAPLAIESVVQPGVDLPVRVRAGMAVSLVLGALAVQSLQS